MFIRSTTHIDEHAFCEAYKKADEEFLKKESYDSAMEILRMNSEEYKAYGVLENGLMPANQREQLYLTQEIIENNPNSWHAWRYRMYLMKRLDLLSKDGDSIYDMDIQFVHKVLSADNRNIYAWIHISTVYRYSPRIIEDELSKSISNYSAYFASVENGTYRSIKQEDIKNIVFTDPGISSPWVFVRIAETARRFAGQNSFLKQFDTRMEVHLRVPGRTRVVVHCKDKVTKYTADFKKVVAIPFEADGFSFADISRIEIKTKGQQTVDISLDSPLAMRPPKFVSEFLGKNPTVESLLTKLHFTTEESARVSVLKELQKMDPKRKHMYMDLKEGFTVFSGK
ncbi:uncharacterized protein NEMAJ01_1675 [Nematocida major]|uniref:uncharacterized protein n=1 Tax=Nematocida major TaxID=1912982 RepID=UPI0020076394|nr:uncharacterized protein NEMAJ01_1675 [Nematocida major]KAH9386779.1 hypothetical protein NEMAJ01_1675 [Nematocida major]